MYQEVHDFILAIHVTMKQSIFGFVYCKGFSWLCRLYAPNT